MFGVTVVEAYVQGAFVLEARTCQGEAVECPAVVMTTPVVTALVSVHYCPLVR